MKPGIYPNIPIREYHAMPGISSSKITTLHDAPMKFAYSLFSQEPQTADLLIGSAVHKLVLEPMDFFHEFRGVSATTRNTRLYKEESKKHPGKMLLLQEELIRCQAIADSVLENDTVRPLIDASSIELSHFAMIEDILGKCRPDIEAIKNMGIVADLKTCQSAKPRDFRRDIFKFGYHIKAAWYLLIVEKTTGIKNNDFLWIAVEKKKPHIVQLFQASPRLLEKGRLICLEALDKLRECMDTNYWYGYTQDEIMEIDSYADL